MFGSHRHRSSGNTGVDKFFSRCPIFLARSFTCAQDRERKQRGAQNQTEILIVILMVDVWLKLQMEIVDLNDSMFTCLPSLHIFL